MFITFEGLDHSGKTTQAELLVDKLKKLGNEVLFLREPGGTAFSERIRDILLDHKNHDMNVTAELLLFSAARSQLVTQVIRPSLEKGIIVICDRFFDSTTAYQGYGRGIKLEEVKLLNKIAVGETIPNLTLFIDVKIEEIFRRRSSAGLFADRMESSGIQFYERVRTGYLKLAAEEPERFVVIGGEQPVEDIHNQIWKIVQQRLK